MKNIKELELGFADAANYRKRENKDLFKDELTATRLNIWIDCVSQTFHF